MIQASIVRPKLGFNIGKFALLRVSARLLLFIFRKQKPREKGLVYYISCGSFFADNFSTEKSFALTRNGKMVNN